MTGNGFTASDVGPVNHAQSFVQLSPTLGELGWFTPPNAAAESADDVDLGSSGPVLIPGTTNLIGAGKDGMLFLLDQNTALGMRQIFQASAPEDSNKPFRAGLHHVHGAPVVWRTSPSTVRVYLWPERDTLRVFSYSDTTATFSPTGASSMSTVQTPPGAGPYGTNMPGGILSLSADGNRHASGVLWASHEKSDDALTNVVSAIMRAFNAEDVTMELWNSEQVPARDSVGLFAKYVPPTVADGRVYLATFSNQIAVYGLRQWATSVSPASGPGTVNKGASFTFDVIFENTGITPWTTNGGFALTSTAAFGPSSFALPRAVIAPGEWATFPITLVAPNTAGTFAVSFQMTDAIALFGETTPPMHVIVQ